MSDDWSRWSALPHLVLADPDADAVELALGGALTVSQQPVVASSPLGAVVLLDEENTPLAVRSESHAPLEALRPRGVRGGEDADPRYRVPALEVRTRLGGRSVLGVLLDDVAGTDELERIAARAAGADDVVLLCLVGTPRPSYATDVSGAGVVRAAVALADELTRTAGAATTTVAVPWAAEAGLDRLAWPGEKAPSLEDIARAYGATDVLDLSARPGAGRQEFAEAVRRRDAVLAESFPAASARELSGAATAGVGPGAVVLFTGLSGSGKSTVAKAVAQRLEVSSARRVVVLDGDEVRHMLSAGLGFDRESRSQNVRRIGYVASLVAGAGGIALAAAIAPYEADRADVRHRTEAAATFVLVHVATPLEVCEARDRKHLYARARAGEVPEFTGVSAPYEEPHDADLVIDTTELDLAAAVDAVLATLRKAGVE
ncbi:adenylyl-sulfate kinase [Cellulomonas sp. DKR-3]|uniref:adenylyl-sulfate kinase n=1 Tax=Cellulomonas fulva TaxID=2835530 RepID=A0ABS5TZL3_9CELL|nr:adenylyl-sulfate kinase [Cellulomonas fulva]MBT0994594.1 adenylyl-sulfate kinase [Cellulomonas fulva]